jgi:ligand-binding sensor domain-containing protein
VSKTFVQKVDNKWLAALLLMFSLLNACTGNSDITSTDTGLITNTQTSELPGNSSDIEAELEPIPASSITSPNPPRNIRFSHISTDEGLSQSVIRSILQDSQGFMWFGTEDGLNRYDGYSFLVFRPNPDDFYSLNDIWINTLFEDSQGYIWIGTRQGGLNRYDPHTGHFTHYMNDPLVQNSLISNTVNAIQEDNDGNIWVGTDLGLDRFNSVTDTFKHYYISPAGIDAPIDYNITAILKASNGILWIGTTANGLKRFNPTTGSFRSFTHDPANSTSISDSTGKLRFSSDTATHSVQIA